MSDDSDTSDSDQGPDFVGSLAETAIALKTGLPPQVQRSFWKAIQRIFTAGAEWPASFLEGKARNTAARASIGVAQSDAEVAEIKSKQQARALVISESAKAAALQFGDETLAKRALQFHGAQIVHEQSRVEGVLLAAAEELKQNPPEGDSEKVIEDDILETILREGSRRSSEEFRILFGRILAGEIKNPGSFSIGTVQSLGRLNASSAADFQLFCNLSSSVGENPKVISSPFGNPGENSMGPFGLYYDTLAGLVEDGLVRSDFQEWRDVEPPSWNMPVLFEHAGNVLFIMKSSDENAPIPPSKLRLTGPSFTKAGQELRSIVTMEHSQAYLDKLVEWLKTHGLQIYRPPAS